MFAYMPFSLGRGRKLAQIAQAYLPRSPSLLIGGNNQPPIEEVIELKDNGCVQDIPSLFRSC